MIKRTFVCLLSLSFALSFMACDNKDKEAETQLNQEIMKIHDEVMPKMSELNRMKRQITTYKDEVSDDNAAMKDSLITEALMLSKTEDNMTDWMGNYKYPNPDIKHEEMMTYLKGKQDTIKQISNDIFMALAIGNGLLKNAPKPAKE